MEIVVVDTGSTDNTRQKAGKYTDKIYDFEWIDDFSAARNFAVSKASNNWILILDCDEYVQNIDTAKLRMCMQKYPKGVGVIEIRNVYTTEGVENIQIEEVPSFLTEIIMSTNFGFMNKLHPKMQKNMMKLCLRQFIFQ